YREYKAFWTKERLRKADSLGLTPTEVATLASIVESETHNEKEYPIIASLYLNRLRKGMPLQACPTVIFATGDLKMRRVLKRHLKIDSPYNTYINRGLPPGPIRCAMGSTMDAVLNAPETDYLYMCANPDWSGTHIFSAKYSVHAETAKAYQQELNARQIH
ncbi:MAG: endolytic transglycosylase MltG, partial [Paludibacteraceae bacterium]|nr:endolytic transglycosylase MltG [Paludibacteraceae bacterium]